MVLNRIGVMSCGKVMGALYGGMGLIFGAIVSLFAVFGATMGGTGFGIELFAGVGAVVLLPLLYGVFGFLGGLITAALYNLVAGLVGGLELELGG